MELKARINTCIVNRILLPQRMTRIAWLFQHVTLHHLTMNLKILLIQSNQKDGVYCKTLILHVTQLLVKEFKMQNDMRARIDYHFY